MRAASCVALFSGCLLVITASAASTAMPADEQVTVVPGPQVIPREQCLHGGNESAEEASRREEARRAMQVIYYAVARSAVRPLPTWESLAGSPVVQELQNAGTPAGALARKLQWGAAEPLPGWRIAYRVFGLEVRFELTDTRDPCRFSYSSSDPRVIPPGIARIVPLDS
jgi:hypothetical protein